jgi:hypothetical protein
MSKSKEQPTSKQGQRGKKYDLPIGDLTSNEKKVVNALSSSAEPILTISELVESLGWNRLRASGQNEEFKGHARGNSRVRNTLRRLVKGRWVCHASRYGDGRYKLTERATTALRKAKRSKSRSTTTAQATA